LRKWGKNLQRSRLDVNAMANLHRFSPYLRNAYFNNAAAYDAIVSDEEMVIPRDRMGGLWRSPAADLKLTNLRILHTFSDVSSPDNYAAAADHYLTDFGLSRIRAAGKYRDSSRTELNAGCRQLEVELKAASHFAQILGLDKKA